VGREQEAAVGRSRWSVAPWDGGSECDPFYAESAFVFFRSHVILRVALCPHEVLRRSYGGRILLCTRLRVVAVRSRV
jgi:hypothetical protein